MFLRRSLLLALVLSVPLLASAQSGGRLTEEAHAKQITALQAELNAEYRDPKQSPLPPAALRKFKALPFFQIDYRYYVTATFERDSASAPFRMPTTRPREAMYRRYGELRFTLDGQPHRLTVYQSLDLLKKPGYEDYLFVPFTDATNGHQSYGGGRYLDLRLPLGPEVQLDFNRAYNPYCAYSDQYACPIPPSENRLPVAIKAGVMSDH